MDHLRRIFRTILMLLGAATLAIAQEQPNIVLIVTDDQGWWDIGSHGNEAIETPNMDRLAAEGVELTRFYVQPVCAPTRAGLMTGRHYVRTGLYNTRFGGDTLHAGERTLAEMLRQAGYRTGIFGKWHLGEYRRYHPDQRGFDEAVYFSAGHTERYWEPDALLRDGRRVHVRGHFTDVLTDAASTFVRSSGDRPFFLYLTYNVPHTPLIVSDALDEKYRAKGLNANDARIYGLIEQCDAAIGRLLGGDRGRGAAAADRRPLHERQRRRQSTLPRWFAGRQGLGLRRGRAVSVLRPMAWPLRDRAQDGRKGVPS